MAENRVVIGCKARDKVSGFEGIVISRIEYLSGRVQYGIQPPAEKATGNAEQSRYFDDKQVEYLGKGVSAAPIPTGGPSAYSPFS